MNGDLTEELPFKLPVRVVSSKPPLAFHLIMQNSEDRLGIAGCVSRKVADAIVAALNAYQPKEIATHRGDAVSVPRIVAENLLDEIDDHGDGAEWLRDALRSALAEGKV